MTLLDRKTNAGANLYIDTRGCEREPVSFTQALIAGLATGGGLYVPQEIPTLTLDEIVSLANLDYRKRAAYIYRAFNIDLDDDIIDSCMKKSYGDNFDDSAICPITDLDNGMHLLELWHGPTSAFKDMALQCLPNFFSASAEKLKRKGELDHEFFILVATSGDTGKAALEGFKGTPGVSVGVLFPDGGVSDIQRKQMVTTKGDNVCVWGVRGNFDDCQNIAKRVFSDDEFASKLQSEYSIALSSANSINWGRLLPQIVYYVSSYAEMVKQGTVEKGRPIDVCVPTGNFGNILAAWYAKQLGTPIDNLVCASNENCVLTDFITSGTYDISNREFMLTPSPSMDILISSNLERQLFELSGRNTQSISKWMSDLKEKKTFTVDAQTASLLQQTFKAGFADSSECLATIKSVFDSSGYLMDPHTAVAYSVASRMRGENPMLVASTAHWAKFGANVYRALHNIDAHDKLPEDISALTGCQLNDLIAEETGQTYIPDGLANLDNEPVRFSDVVDNNVAAVEGVLASFFE